MWRKALLRFKIIFALCVPLVFAQTSTTSAEDSFPSIHIDAPSMPSVSSPSIGGSYYFPRKPASNIYTGPSQKKVQASAQKNENDSLKKDYSADEDELTRLTKSALSAKDLSALSDLGLLDFDSSIFSSSLSPKKLLEQYLRKAEKVSQENQEAAQKIQEKNVSETPAAELVKNSPAINAQSVPEKIKPRLLRFNVNGYDILKTCSKIYTSSVQNDGSFLITGDRRYSSDGKLRTETFHILFKTKKEADDSANYSAAVSVTQDYLNPYSFVYQLSNKNNLSALRTGNLLSMRLNEPNWQLEFLVDVGEE